MTGTDHPELTCAMCGETYTRHPSYAPKSRFCSSDCRYQFMSECPEEFCNWTNGEAHEALLEGVREEYEHTCVNCGDAHGPEDESIPVHHLVPSNRFIEGEDENAHFEENLLPLCVPCHNKWDNATRQLLDGVEVSDSEVAEAVTEAFRTNMGDDLAPLAENAPRLLPVVRAQILSESTDRMPNPEEWEAVEVSAPSTGTFPFDPDDPRRWGVEDEGESEMDDRDQD